MMKFPKENAVRSEPYLRLVASLECCKCGIQGRSQAAHPPPTGKGIKQDDRLCFPLCADSPGGAGCHSRFDQYKFWTRDDSMTMARLWGAQTRKRIEEAGLWPPRLPMLP